MFVTSGLQQDLSLYSGLIQKVLRDDNSACTLPGISHIVELGCPICRIQDVSPVFGDPTEQLYRIVWQQKSHWRLLKSQRTLELTLLYFLVEEAEPRQIQGLTQGT